MKTTPDRLIRYIIAPAALAVGVMIGRIGNGAPSPAASPDAGSSLRPESRSTSVSGGSSATRDAARVNRPSAGNATGTHRLRALLDRIDRMSGPEIEVLLNDMRLQGLDLARRDEFLLTLSSWAERDPLAAAGFVMATGGDDEMKAAALGAWAESDPEAALRWIRETHADDAAHPWLVGVAKGLAPHDPDAARTLIEELPRGRFRNRALDATLGHILQRGGDFAADWINAAGDERLQRSSAGWIAEQMAERDPDAAAAWLESLQGSARLEAAEQVADRMAASDPAAAFHWLAEIGSGEEIDPALRDIVRSGFDQDPASALTASLHLSDERAKARFASRYLERWQETDPAAAAAWLQSHATYLPENVRERFLAADSRTPLIRR